MTPISSRALAALLALAPLSATADVFVNEIHYDDADAPNSGDQNEAVEIVATAGESLADYDVVLYNGSNAAAAAVYDTDAVPAGTQVACGATVRIGVIAYTGGASSQLQNGTADAIALVRRADGVVVQFISYEGAATASGGAADGLTSTSIPVSETNSTVEGTSLQLGGNASTYAGFTWNPSATSTFGACNPGQTFGTPVDNPPAVIDSTPDAGATDVAVDDALALTFSEVIALDAGGVTLTCASVVQPLTIDGADASYSLLPDAPLPYGAACTLQVLAGAALDQDGTNDPMAADYTLSFTTRVDDPPVLMSSTPSDGSTTFAANASLQLTFSEPVALGATWFAIDCDVSGDRVVADTVVGGGPNAWSINPNADFAQGESCTLTLDPAQIEDLDGIAHDFIGDTTIAFTPAAPAVDPRPTVLSTTPMNGADDFPSTGDLVVLFSEPVTLAPGAFALSCAQTAGIVLTHASVGTSFTIDTGVVLAPTEHCTFTIESSAVTDGNGQTPLADVVVEFDVATDDLAAYYAQVNTSSPDQLRCSLHQTIRNHTVRTYSEAWSILEAAEEDPANASRVLDAYRNCSYAAGPTGDRVGGTGGGATCGSDPGERYNREHTWPNSLGFPDQGLAAYTDTHMLYATDEGYNATRGNKPYANCTGCTTEEPTEPNDGRGGGTGVYPGNSNWSNGNSYEVWNARKGDMARAVMYMAIRYEGGDSLPDLELTDTRALIVGTPASATTAWMGLLSTLVQWHQFDPPDADEVVRNGVIQGFQGNRNPFIDHPEWATAALFTSSQPTTCTLGGGGNTAPVAVDDLYAATEDALLTVAALDGVLDNDTDAEADALTAQLVAQAMRGTVTLNANGGFSYQPTANLCGDDQFTYRAHDGQAQSAVAIATLQVACVNDAPTVNAATFALAENSANGALAGTVVAADADTGTTLSYAITAGNTGGAFAIEADGELRVANVAALDYETTPSFALTVQVSDGASPVPGTASATITVDLSDVVEPAVANDDTLAVAEDAIDAALAVLTNDVASPDDGLIQIIAVSTPAHGSVAFTAGSIAYTPAANYCGDDAFVYTVAGNDTAQVTLSVSCSNDAPVLDFALVGHDAEEGAEIVAFSIADAFSDVDGDDLDFSATGLPPGLAIDAETGVISGTPAAGSASGSPYLVTITASDGTASTQQPFSYAVTLRDAAIFDDGFEGS